MNGSRAAGRVGASAVAPPVSVAAAARKRKVEKFAMMSEEDRREKAMNLASEYIQLVKEKGIKCTGRLHDVELLASFETAIELAQRAGDSKPTVAKKRVKMSMSPQETFDQKVLRKIDFVLTMYKNGIFDDQAAMTEAELKNLLDNPNATPAQYRAVDIKVCRVASIAYNMILIAERMRGQLIRGAIKSFCTNGDTIDEEALPAMIKNLFGMDVFTAESTMYLSDLFMMYPRLLLVSTEPATFYTVWKPLLKWLELNTSEAAELRRGFSPIVMSASMSLDHTISIGESLAVDGITKASRFIQPEYDNMHASMLTPALPSAEDVADAAAAAAAASAAASASAAAPRPPPRDRAHVRSAIKTAKSTVTVRGLAAFNPSRGTYRIDPPIEEEEMPVENGQEAEEAALLGDDEPTTKVPSPMTDLSNHLADSSVNDS
jgi:hypothetical protein